MHNTRSLNQQLEFDPFSENLNNNIMLLKKASNAYQ